MWTKGGGTLHLTTATTFRTLRVTDMTLFVSLPAHVRVLGRFSLAMLKYDVKFGEVVVKGSKRPLSFL